MRQGVKCPTRCPPCPPAPWWWSGCTVLGPSGVEPARSCSRWPFWSWPVCSGTRSWSGTRWGSVPGPAIAAAAPWCSDWPGTHFSVSAAAQQWRPSWAACPPCCSSSSSVSWSWGLAWKQQWKTKQIFILQLEFGFHCRAAAAAAAAAAKHSWCSRFSIIWFIWSNVGQHHRSKFSLSRQ